jgi:hypothetical protein
MKNLKPIIAGLLLLGLISCKKDEPKDLIEYASDFSSGTDGWSGFFSDYPVGSEDFYELTFEWSSLPEPLDTGVKAVKISGNNHSDDLLSLITRKFDGLVPNTDYDVTFDLDLASNTPENAMGVGGDPNLALGAGGIPVAPKNQVDVLDYQRPNFSSLLQSGLSNETLRVLGRIGVSEEIPTKFKLINRNNLEDPILLKTNANGEIYLLIGVDSGFEATTTLYYKNIRVKMVKV